MTAQPIRPATPDSLMVWILHRFADVFSHHAILKGGMSLRLLDSPRYTNDLDFVFVPYRSKNDVKDGIQAVLEEIEDAEVTLTLHSKMLRANVQVDAAHVQVEVNVAEQTRSESASTQALARTVGVLPRLIRVMAQDVAMAHKLAAWNERRLLRDLYDVYFYRARLRILPDPDTLKARLSNVNSRLPSLKKTRKMSRPQLVAALAAAVDEIEQNAIHLELGAVLNDEEQAGLAQRMQAVLRELAEQLG